MPRLTVDLKKIKDNSRLVAELLRLHRVRLVGVTKACLGNELVGEAMLAGGAAALADSRLENIANLQRHLPGTELSLMRSPAGGGRLNARPDLSFVSSFEQAKALLELSPAKPLRLCLTIETGDGREGAPPERAPEEAVRIFELQEVELAGLATNAACARHPDSLESTLKIFYETAARVLWRLAKQGFKARRREGAAAPPEDFRKLRSFPIMSAGGSGFLKLLLENEPGSANGGSPLGPLTELRCGEVILLGRIPAGGTQDLFLPDAHRDAFLVEGEVLEVFEKNGEVQALLDLGIQDVGAGRLIPCRVGVTPRSATSDYLAVSLSADEREARGPVRVGSRISFIPTYYALLAAMTSPFVEKRFLDA